MRVVINDDIKIKRRKIIKESCFQVEVLIKECICRRGKNKCTYGSYGSKVINPELHNKFVENMFEAIR